MIAFGYLKIAQFFSKYIYVIVGIVALLLLAVVVPNASSIAERLGFETRASLKAQLAKEEVKADTALQANTNLVQEIEKEKKSSELTLAITDTLSATKTSTVTKITKIKTTRDKVVASATKTNIDDSTQPSTITLPTNNHYTPEAVAQVSTANIDALWSAYEQIKGV
jgi:small-conductance mechanosensitive channel